MRREERREEKESTEDEGTRGREERGELVNGLLAHELMKLDMLQNSRDMIKYSQNVVLQDRSDLYTRRIRARNLSLVVLWHLYDKERLFL